MSLVSVSVPLLVSLLVFSVLLKELKLSRINRAMLHFIWKCRYALTVVEFTDCTYRLLTKLFFSFRPMYASVTELKKP